MVIHYRKRPSPNVSAGVLHCVGRRDKVTAKLAALAAPWRGRLAQVTNTWPASELRQAERISASGRLSELPSRVLVQRPRDILCPRLGVGAREPIDESAAGRVVFEIDIGERDPVRVFDDEGIGGLAGAYR